VDDPTRGRRSPASTADAQRLVNLACGSLNRGAVHRGGAASTFWSFTLPQMCYTDPIVGASATALGAAIQAYKRTRRLDSTQLLYWYGHALEAIRHAVESEDAVSTHVFAASTLLAVTELIVGQELHALAHLEGALKLLTYRQQQRQLQQAATQADDTETFQVLDEVDAAGAVLDISAASYALSIEPRLSAFAPKPISSGDYTSLGLSSLEVEVLRCLHNAYRFTATSYQWRYAPRQFRPGRLQVQQECYANLLFCLANELRSAISNLNLDESMRVCVLCAQCLSCLIYNSCLFEPRESSYDRFFSTFEEIVSHAEAFCDYREPSSVSEELELTLDLGIVQPLYFTAFKCREPQIRRRAVRALEMTKRDGPFDGREYAAVARRVIELEESSARSGQATDQRAGHWLVPEGLRLHGAGVEVTPMFESKDAHVTAMFSRCRDVHGMLAEDDPDAFHQSKWWDIWDESIPMSSERSFMGE
jgi:hypothetical protein